MLLNPAHPHFELIELGELEDLRTDLRLIRDQDETNSLYAALRVRRIDP